MTASRVTYLNVLDGISTSAILEIREAVIEWHHMGMCDEAVLIELENFKNDLSAELQHRAEAQRTFVQTPVLGKDFEGAEIVDNGDLL